MELNLGSILARAGVKKFRLLRDGVSVAEGVQFSNGNCAIKWTEPAIPGLQAVVSQWDSLTEALAVNRDLALEWRS